MCSCYWACCRCCLDSNWYLLQFHYITGCAVSFHISQYIPWQRVYYFFRKLGHQWKIFTSQRIILLHDLSSHYYLQTTYFEFDKLNINEFDPLFMYRFLKKSELNSNWYPFINISTWTINFLVQFKKYRVCKLQLPM